MKILYSIKILSYNKRKNCYDNIYIYRRASGLVSLAIYLSVNFLPWEVLQVKRLKRVYRKNIKVIEV